MENNEASKSEITSNSSTRIPKEISLSELAKSLKFLDKLVPPSKENLLRFESLSELLNKDKNFGNTQIIIPTFDSIADKAGAIIAEYFAAFSLGALLGASITTGILFGTFFITSFFNHSRFPFSFKRKKREITPKENAEYLDKNSLKDDVENDIASSFSISSSKNDKVCVIPSSKSIIILSEKASLTSIKNEKNMQDVKYKCIKNCLDAISDKLSKQNLSWKENVVKITAYLVILGNETQLYNSSEFRSILKEYIKDNDGIDDDNDELDMMITILFVHYLENESIMQIEVLSTA